MAGEFRRGREDAGQAVYETNALIACVWNALYADTFLDECSVEDKPVYCMQHSMPKLHLMP